MSSERESKPEDGATTWPELVGSLESLKEADQLVKEMLRRFRDVARFAEDRFRQLVARAAAKAADYRDDKVLMEVSPKVIRAVAEAVLIEEDDELRILWENLLSNAMAGMSVDQFVLNVIQQLDSASARALNELASVPWPLCGDVDHYTREELLRYGHATTRLESLGLLCRVRVHYYDDLSISNHLESDDVEDLRQAVQFLYDALRAEHLRVSDFGYLVCTMVSEPGESFPKMSELP